MVSYALPQALFPPYDDLVRTSLEGTFTPFEKELRALACAGYTLPGSPDSELTRFIIPALPWEAKAQDRPFYKALGERSWIASASLAPFIPEKLRDRLRNLYEEQRSAAHLIGATFTACTLMYCAEDGRIELPPMQEGSRELLCIVVEPSVKVHIEDTVLFTTGFTARSLVAVVSEQAEVSIVQDLQVPKASLLQHERWYLGPDARLTQEQLLTGGIQTWLGKEFTLAARSTVAVTFLAALKDSEQSVLTTVQEHKEPGATSSVLVKSALTDSSRSFYRGTIMVAQEAQHSTAHQQQRALMLSQKAQTCAIPSLEVATHEVQCSHGSAAGKFSDEDIWYMLSRGFSPDEAEAILIEGFFHEPLIIRRTDFLTRVKECLRRT